MQITPTKVLYLHACLTLSVFKDKVLECFQNFKMPNKLDMLITQMITFLIIVAKDYINKNLKRISKGCPIYALNLRSFIKRMI